PRIRRHAHTRKSLGTRPSNPPPRRNNTHQARHSAHTRKPETNGREPMNRLATAAWAVASISWLLTAHNSDSPAHIVFCILLAIASGCAALAHRDKEDR